MFATEQCLLVLSHHPSVWHQAAQFLDSSSKNLAEKGVRINFLIIIFEINVTVLKNLKYFSFTRKPDRTFMFEIESKTLITKQVFKLKNELLSRRILLLFN